jgi:hypothetical protein
MNKKRMLICTFMALASGCFGAYMGVQIKLLADNHRCENMTKNTLEFAAFKTACQAWMMPGAYMQGSSSGLWAGMVMGAFIAGLATHHKQPE